MEDWHLIFTGKNGSGKTTLLDSLAESLDSMNQNCLYRYDNQKDMDIIWTDDMSVFDFNTLSSGYAAVLDIVVDIMLRMERRIKKTFIYDLAGIVLIDEIETHLHLELQKKVLDLLTTIFPYIQFIVTTHSPFVLNNLENVVIYDLEQNILVENGLANIPYDGIVEGYFHADVLSEKLKEK